MFRGRRRRRIYGTGIAHIAQPINLHAVVLVINADQFLLSSILLKVFGSFAFSFFQFFGALVQVGYRVQLQVGLVLGLSLGLGLIGHCTYSHYPRRKADPTRLSQLFYFTLDHHL